MSDPIGEEGEFEGMPQATFVQDGSSIDHTPGTALATGDVVVQGDLVGVVKRPLAANEAGSLSVEGVFDFAKSGVTSYTLGQILYWDDTNNIVTSTAAPNKLIGKVIRAAQLSDTTVRIRMSQ